MDARGNSSLRPAQGRGFSPLVLTLGQKLPLQIFPSAEDHATNNETAENWRLPSPGWGKPQKVPSEVFLQVGGMRPNQAEGRAESAP